MASEEKNSINHLFEEIAGLIVIAASIFYLVSLITYSPSDPSLNNYSTGIKAVNNLGGIVGAYLSDISLQLFGYSSFILPAVTATGGIFLLIKKRFSLKDAGKIAGLVLLMLSSATLLSLLDLKGLSAFKGGGLVGTSASSVLVSYLNHAGAYLFTVLAIILSFTLSTGISTVHVTSIISGTLFDLSRNAVSTARKLAQKYLERRKRLKETKEQLQREKEKKKNTPTIIVEQKEIPKKKKKMEDIQEDLPFMKIESEGGVSLPTLSLLDSVEKRTKDVDKESILMNSRILEKKLRDFGVEGEVKEVHPGPVVTMYEFVPAPGVKVNKIVNLSDDLSMALSAISIRIVAPIPGKAVVGIEVPNSVRETVYFKEILASDEFLNVKSFLTLAMGKDIAGQPVAADLAKMPHLLVAGATGAGKSVAVNSMICSILYKATPEDVRLIMVDPKMLELSIYDGIPHLLLPVVTDPKKAALALRWAVREMERRYELLSMTGVKNISGYNRLVKEHPIFRKKNEDGEEEEITLEKLPYIVIIIDELADLMMIASREVEESITRLAQMARASGIHLILATQRPSVDVITGIIKANFPARVSFQVSSKTDSRTILDANGAENLLGLGDMLFLRPGTSKVQRVHGTFISEAETHRVVDFLKKRGVKPDYDESIVKPKDDEAAGDADEEFDEKYDEAVAIVSQAGTASISMIQRRMRIGYNRAARMIERMEEEGVVGPSDGTSKGREVLAGRI